MNRDAYTGGEQEGQDLPFKLNSFHLFYLQKGHLLALKIVWFKKIFWGQAPEPQISILLLGDLYIKHRSSGKEF